MPTPPDQPIPPVRKSGPTPHPKIVKPPSLAEALKDALPERNHRFIPANVSAIEAGAARVTSQRT